MKIVELVAITHDYKIGGACPELEPNVKEDTLFTVGGQAIGFFIRELKGDITKYLDIANNELRSKRVPKDEMKRSSGLRDKEKEVLQYSTIIGGVPPRSHMLRPYATMSSVHQVKTAQTFIKAMLIVATRAEEIIHTIAPEIYNQQAETINANIPLKWRFGRLFTSSISNYNISANFHRDTGNLENCSNVIITKRKDSTGGNLFVPDYNLVFDCVDNSMIVYPAWRNVHAVTPIVPTKSGGYRNSLVFYPLKAFNDLI